MESVVIAAVLGAIDDVRCTRCMSFDSASSALDHATTRLLAGRRIAAKAAVVAGELVGTVACSSVFVVGIFGVLALEANPVWSDCHDGVRLDWSDIDTGGDMKASLEVVEMGDIADDGVVEEEGAGEKKETVVEGESYGRDEGCGGSGCGCG